MQNIYTKPKYMITNPNPRNPGRPQKGLYRRDLNTAPAATAFLYEGVYTIYGLSSNHEPENIKYVGYTSMLLNRRYTNHVSSAKKNHTPKEQWIKGVLDNDHQIIMTILEDGILTRSEAFAKEKQRIKELREAEIVEAGLTNVVEGGAGTSGLVHTEETKQKQRKANLGKQFKKGKPVTEATREKLRAAARNRRERAQEAKQRKNN